MPIKVVAAILYAVAAIFFGLYLWARSNPLPAAISGLVIFSTLILVDAVADPQSIARGIIVKIVVVVILIQAISAGIKYRKLTQQMPNP